jgi:carboxyl-terminal processing protease
MRTMRSIHLLHVSLAYPSAPVSGAFRSAARTLALAALATGCMSFGQAANQLPKSGSDTQITESALGRAQSLYLYPERFNRRMLVGALDALEARFDPVRFEEDPMRGDVPPTWGTLWVGDEGARVPIAEELVPQQFARVLGQVLSFVEARLPKEPKPDEDSDVELIALQGALAELDRYSTVFSERSTEDFEIRFSGKLSGIGTRISREEGILKAVEVFPDGPAQRAGMRDGDAIELIDGDPTQALSLRDAVDRLRGRSGTEVVVGILRVDAKSKAEEHLQLSITRDEVNVPSVDAKLLEDGIGYARIRTVSRLTHEEFKDKVLSLGELRGLVLDLRGNTGGSMLAAAALADYFVSSDTIVRVVDRNGDGADVPGSAAIATPSVLFRMPVAVLVDGMTASAAEILAGAIAPLERVTVIGQRTFGKGLIQRVITLPREHMLKLTVGEYLLSGDRAIHEKGLEPDVPLYPVSEENLGALAQRPGRALAYLRDPRADDPHPLDFAKALLREGRNAATTRFGKEWNGEIERRLTGYGVAWSAPTAIPASQLQVKLRVEGGPSRVLDGTPTQIVVKVSNPNTIDVPDVWASLSGPVDYLGNKLIALGTVPAGGSLSSSIEVKPDDGLATSPMPLFVHVSSGPNALQTERLKVPVQMHPPALRIDIARNKQAGTASVSLSNLGCCAAGTVLVAVPGTSRPVPELLPGKTETVELPLSGDVENISVLLAGAGVSQRIEVPVPDQDVSVRPPELRMTRTALFGRRQLRVDMASGEGLQEGWLALDGQKETYVAWAGASDGTLRADLGRVRSRSVSQPPPPSPDLGAGDISVQTKVETVSGVTVLDVRTLIAD